MTTEDQLLDAERKKFSVKFRKPKRVSTSLRTKDQTISKKARKAVNLIAPKSSFVRRATQTSKGRGRPSGTFKTRVLPSGRVVRVPTDIYNKLLAQEKAQMRLARARRQFEADQLAMTQDPRFQGSPTEDMFLAETDQIHEMNVLKAQQEAEMAQISPQMPQIQRKQPGMIGKMVNGINRLGSSIGARKPQLVGYDEFGRPVFQEMAQISPQIQNMRPRDPKVRVFEGQSSILNTPNIFNNQGQSNLAKRGSLI